MNERSGKWRIRKDRDKWLVFKPGATEPSATCTDHALAVWMTQWLGASYREFQEYRMAQRLAVGIDQQLADTVQRLHHRGALSLGATGEA